MKPPGWGTHTTETDKCYVISPLVLPPRTVPCASLSHILGEETEAQRGAECWPPQLGREGYRGGTRAQGGQRLDTPGAQSCPQHPCRPRQPRCSPAPTGVRCPLGPPAVNLRANLSPSRPLSGRNGWAPASRLLRNHSAARQALNLTQGVLKGGMSVFITYLSYNKYLKSALTSSPAQSASVAGRQI